MDLKRREREGMKAVWFSLAGNAFLALFKFFGGLFSGSTALIADGLHSLSDMLSSVVVYVGLKLSAKPPDKTHPYGHGDAESIAGLVVAMMLLVVVFEFFRGTVLKSILDPQANMLNDFAVLIALSSILLNEAMTRYAKEKASLIDSVALEADAYHHRSDAYSSIVVLLGVWWARYFPLADPIAGLVVCGWILWMAVKLGYKSATLLMGTVSDPKKVSAVKDAAEGVKGVQDAHRIKLHYFGAYAIADMHIGVDKYTSLKKSHRIAHKVESEVKKLDFIKSVTVHVDPVSVKNLKKAN